MLRMLRSWLDSPEREARRLNRDAPAIVEQTTLGYPVARVRDVASATAEHLGRSREHLAEHPGARDDVLARFREIHRDARRRNDQVALTAITLAIIALRAEALGETARPAAAAVEAFVDEWAGEAEAGA